MSSVTVYTHADCHLCEEALSVLRAIQAHSSFELIERDIHADEALERAYFERVPVIVVDGEEVCEFVVDETRVRERLARGVRTP